MPKGQRNVAIPEPFLKWAGGKRQLVDRLRARMPASYGTYYEPFIGGGALFFAAAPTRAVLSDNNPRLVRTWRAVQRQVEEVVERLCEHRVEEAYFYELRKQDIDRASSDAEVAAWMIYLNKTAFNGLYRVNSKGRFNTPWGRYDNPRICDIPRLMEVSRVLQGVTIELGDFVEVARRAEAGDFVYFDPPYEPLSASSSFRAYTKQGFGADDQRRLRDLALELKGRGVHVLLSNSSAPLILELYQEGFEVELVSASRLINSVGSGRGAVKEVLVR